MDQVYDAYDCYKETVRKAHGNDSEIEAIALYHLGKLQYQMFKELEKAKDFYHKCLRVAFLLSEAKDFKNKTWYKNASKHLAEIQIVKQKEDDAKKEPSPEILTEIKPELDLLFAAKVKGIFELMTLLLTEKFWPKDHEKIDLKVLELTTKEQLKLKVQEFVGKFHADKHPNATEKEKVLYKRVSQTLQEKYDVLKGIEV